jgi:hypothetical protein
MEQNASSRPDCWNPYFLTARHGYGIYCLGRSCRNMQHLTRPVGRTMKLLPMILLGRKAMMLLPMGFTLANTP